MKRFAGAVAVIGALVVGVAGGIAGWRFSLADGSDRVGRPASPAANLSGFGEDEKRGPAAGEASPVGGEGGAGGPIASVSGGDPSGGDHPADGDRFPPAPSPDAGGSAGAPKPGRSDAPASGALPQGGPPGPGTPAPAAGAGEATADPFALPTAAKEVPDPLSLLVLVNKAHRLPPDFRPPDLVPVAIPFDKPEGDERRLMRREAARAIEALVRAAEADGIRLIGVSAFRSYELQKQIFQANVRRKGEAEALKVSAPPGMSEHQTGLAIDVADRSGRCLLEPCFGASAAGRWLQAHAPTFGFIIRYPEGQESVTGYMYEPWHLRYVGVDAARAIAERYGTLEAYLAARPPEREVSAPAEHRADGSAEPQAAGSAVFQGAGPPERGGSGPPERPAEGPPAPDPAAPAPDPAAP
ncbi:MAG: D-alanyl-D-alanine carboxypeptidase [Hydrogenibacillus schlegelii]|uniref:D-alanyl-D-alanine carboxypeptidase n=2 Tax=Hydrogenibacillus schlegelii TaxID=1484 RepID=A0A2T5GC80_HYDSH|nr:M15 family metallopeptidase [Hydrogenibacillus schlegelii]PTQ53799.1 MAG: D-alanyl-D-alanine carboxypeptidase [Hydrogenibacillus schlegelii]